LSDSSSYAMSSVAENARRLSKRLLAICIVLTMVLSPLFVVVANAESEPSIWTSDDEYVPGEAVVIYGEDWVMFEAVKIEFSHPDLETATYEVTPDIYGRFVFDDYVARAVYQDSISVNVTATQYRDGELTVAYTEFRDPTNAMEAFTLRPHERWTDGEVKGWNEGDSVPFKVKLYKAGFGSDFVNITLGFDFIDLNGPQPIYGIDYLTQYWLEPPTSPFSTYPNSSQPFFVDSSQGVITSQSRLANQYDSGTHQVIQVWKFTLQFASGASLAVVRFGAHLALTNLAMNYYGASYYPGSSLHVRFVEIDPPANMGNMDVAIALGTLLMPPKMNLEKWCDPTVVVYGDVITFTIHFNNTGQADAACVMLEDWLPWVVDLVPGSFLFWTSQNPVPMPPSPGPVVIGNYFYWSIGYWPGMGAESANPPLEGYLSFNATVETSEPGCYRNVAWLNYSDDHGGVFPPEYAECWFCILAPPDIMIEKSGPYYAHVGDEITYAYNVTNTGTVVLYDVEVEDDIAGLIVLGETLLVGQSKTFYKTYNITQNDTDPLRNNVTVEGHDEYGRYVNDTAYWVVDILHPDIVVEKYADKECAKVGEEIWYTITVRNPTSDTALYNVTVADSLLGMVWDNITLLPGSWETRNLNYTVSDPDFDPLPNIVQAEGEDLLNYHVANSTSVEIDILHPDILVTKEANVRCAQVGETIFYWINVTNPSNDTAMDVTVWDLLLNATDPLFKGIIDNETTVPLGPFSYVVPMCVEWVNNTVEVYAFDYQEHYVYREASWSVEIFYPDISVTKEADKTCAEEGEVVLYWINVTNPSLDATMHAVVWDHMLNNTTPLFDGMIAPGMTIPLGPYPYTVPFGVEWVNNTVNVTAWDHQDHIRWAEASWSVEIFHPDILITKEANKVCAEEGEAILYWINVTNPSHDTPMYAVVRDPMLSPLPLFDGWIAPNMTVPLGPYLYYVPIGQGLEWVNNTVNVTAWDHQDHIRWAEATFSVEIFYPDILVTKEADKSCAEEGEAILYWINVTNPSRDATMYAVVWDPMLNATDPLYAGYLAPGETVPLGPYVYYVPECVEWVNNTVNVTAWDHQDHIRWAEASWSVEILHPDISITKEADKECAEVGEQILYWINVTNPSHDIAVHAVVTDPMLSPVPLYDGMIAPNQTVPLGPYVYIVPEGVEWVNNTVNVTAWDYQGHFRWSEANWSVEIFYPDISVTKEADKECAEVGEQILYWINVTNPSPDVAMYAVVWDVMLNASAPLFAGYLAPGQTVPLGPYVYCVPKGVDWVNNTVNVTAWDYQGHLRWAEANWSVEIFYPDISVTKEANKECAEVGEQVLYWINVTNPSPDATMYAIVWDVMLNATNPLFAGYIAPGQTVPLGPYVYVVPQGVEWVNNTVNVTAWDHQDHLRWAEANWSVEILYPDISITKEADRTCAHEGEGILYWINVTNPSPDVAMYAVVWDVMLNATDPLFIGYIAPGVTVHLGPFLYCVPRGVEWVNNTVNVTAEDYQGHVRWAEANWSVEILHPAIEVTKEGPASADMGSVITYYVNVTNTGDTPLYNVTLVDSLKGEVGNFSVLEIGETKSVNYTYLVPLGEGLLNNTVEARGRDRQDVWVNDTANWTVFKNGEVFGYKFADINGNGAMDEGEPIIQGWPITLVGPVSGSTITSPTGYFEFTGLSAGTYLLSEALLLGWKNFTPSFYVFNITSGKVLQFNFGNLPTGNITGYKWEDRDLDGSWDIGEPGVPGWVIYLNGTAINGDVVNLTDTTDENGFYSFVGLLPGLYIVTEGNRTGWYPITDPDVLVNVTGLYPFDVRVDFGNSKLGTITGFKWLDEFMNGYKDGNEVYLANWTIVLEGYTSAGDYVYRETVTGAGGWFIFDNLLPGVYTVREVLKPGWRNITPAEYVVTVGEGSWIHCTKFGNVECGSIDGWKFYDWDMDGVMEYGEPGIPGWAITLTGWLNDGDWPWSPVNARHIGPITIYTDANGYWNFSCLLPGIYTVTEADVPGWHHTTPSSVTLWIASGTHVIDVKFGNVPMICIWGYKFEDVDGDGIWDLGEPGLENWTIVLEGYMSNGTYVYVEMVTDSYGYYVTCYNILPGEYWLYELRKEGWVPTTPPEHLIVHPSDPFEPCVPYDIRIDFGNFELGMIIAWKYEDIDGDGQLDPEDTPIEDWLISIIWMPPPGWIGIPPMPGSNYTDENGRVVFGNLTYGWYNVSEADMPGWIHTNAPWIHVLIQSGSVVNLTPFLNFELGRICGWKFEDLNSNGVWDDGEPPIAGWNITLLNGSPLPIVTTTNESGFFCFRNLTADTYIVWEEQRHGWTNTTPIAYLIEVTSGTEEEVFFGNFENVWICVFKFEDIWGDGEYDYGYDSPIAGWNITVSGPGIANGSIVLVTNASGYACVEVTAAGNYTVTEELRDGWCPTTNVTRYVNVVSGSASPALVEFGNFECVDITIFKYEDVNSNGEYDDGVDNPLAGWELWVYSWYWNDLYPVYTDANGTVTLEFCTYDWIWIWEYLPEDWCQVSPWQGFYEIEITSGMAFDWTNYIERYWYEFGNFKCVEIVVFKYWDTCSNGWYDPGFGDVPIEGWWFGLYNSTGVLIDWGWTNETGYLVFTICRAGNYTIVEEDRENWSHITPPGGYYEIEVKSGDVFQPFEFGNYEHVLVPIFKYEDVDGDGEYDEGLDVPLEGWYFVMVRLGDPATNYSGYTDENGSLVLEVNRSGIYLLSEEVQPGWTPVNPSNGMRFVNVISGIVVPVQMFGNFRNATIILCKVDDVNANGSYEPCLDSMLPGWNFTLWLWVEDHWEFVATNTTGPCGCASFTVTRAGLYLVTEEFRDGWLWIWPTCGYYIFDVDSGDVEEWWFFNFKKGKIYGYKWNDIDGDGRYDVGEPPLAGWTIWFEGTGGGGGGYLTGYNVTNETGYYEFTGLPPGTYKVWEIVQPGWVPTNASQVTGIVIIGHSEVRIDFFNFQLGCIYGWKYEDMNGNGIYDDGDLPLENWTIYLSITTGIVVTPNGSMSAIMLINTTKTDENGFYSFCGLGPGLYVVQEESRSGWNHTNASSETVLLTSGACVRIHDFMNFELGRICGWKFEDLNSNGVWDDGEPPIEGWAMYLLKNHDDGADVTYTNDTGYFCFKDLEADEYIVYEETRDGWCNTTQTAYLVEVTSGTAEELFFGNFECVNITIFKYEDVNGNGVFDWEDRPLENWTINITGPETANVTTDVYGWANLTVCKAGRYTITEESRAGWVNTTPSQLFVDVISGVLLDPLRFGNFELGLIWGEKYYDWDLDGQRDPEEEGLGMLIWINGTLVSGGWLNLSAITDPFTGLFYVPGLPAGTYNVSERLEFAPPGWTPTTATWAIVTIRSGSVEFVSFGNAVFGIVIVHKFYDKNVNGSREEGEPGLAGWTIILEGVTAQGVPVYRTNVTNATGDCMFDNVQPGSYNVTEVVLGGWENTTMLPVHFDVSGSMVYFEILVDIGNIRYGKIWGYKFLDTYEESYPFWPNGLFDPDEFGLGNWEITLEGWTDSGVWVHLVNYTDNGDDLGYYEFAELLPGRYWVNETLLYGYYATRPISNLVIIYPFPMGPVIVRIDFGNLLPSVDPEIPFVLAKGWNMWSSPVMMRNSLYASDLADIIGPNCLKISRLNVSSGKYESFIPDVTTPRSDRDFVIEYGVGYYIVVSAETYFTLRGDLTSSSVMSLTKGWNMVGYNQLPPMKASEFVTHISGCRVYKVTCLDPNTKAYYSYIPGVSGEELDFVMAPGAAYFVTCSGPGELVYP